MLIYDIEIVKAIPPQDDADRVANIDYCAGWDDHANMGVSVIGAYDYTENRYRVFTKDNFHAFKELVDTHKTIVGFNSIKFDNAVVRACGIVDIPNVKSYDILVEIWKAAGFGTEFNYDTHAGFGLDACCQANFGTRKSGHGAMAPVYWQQGEIGFVIDYCLNDVKLTKDLLDLIMLNSRINDPRNPDKYLFVKPPGIIG